MTTITREEVKAFIEQIESDLSNGWEAQIFELKLARIALASLEAEPVAYNQVQRDMMKDIIVRKMGGNLAGEKLVMDDIHAVTMALIDAGFRTAPPAPVVPDERAAFNAWNNEDNLPIAGVGAKNAAWLAWQARASLCGNSALNVPPERPADSSNGDDIEAWFDEGWNACRAAMLQGSQPVSNCDELQVIGWLRSDYNSDDKRDPDAPLFMLGSNNPSETWGVKYMPLTGNSPVTPDGWISCSERMPEDEQEVIVQNKLGYRYVSYFDEQSGLFFDMRGGNQINCIEHILVTHWMPLPVPPQH
ncbi:DUF551 domain-containing protein [Salmonella enterica subsp. enterica serovar Havana]